VVPALVSPPTISDLVQEIVAGDLARIICGRIAGEVGADREDVADAFQEACVKTIRSSHATTMGEATVYLTKTTRSILRQNWRDYSRHEEPVADPYFQHGGRPRPPASDEVVDDEYAAEVTATLQQLAAGLSSRQRVVLALFCQRTQRREIAARLHVAEKRVEKDVAAILRKGRKALVAVVGNGCAEGEDLVAAFAFGLPAGDRIAAQLHIAGCPQCGRLYEQLELFRNKAAAIAPVPAVDQVEPTLVERTLHKLGDAASSLKQNTIDGATHAHARATEGVSHAKGHATSLYTRAADPTPLAGARPGAAVTVLASCLALGGGGTYCVNQGIDPVQGIAGVVAPAEKEPEEKPATPPAPKPQPQVETLAVPQPPTPTPAPEAPQAPPAAEPATPEPQQPAAPPAKPADEFQPLGPTQSAQPAAPQQPAPKKPARAPQSGPNEFF